VEIAMDDELLNDIQVTAERVQRFKELHEASLLDLRDMVTRARMQGVSHAAIEAQIGETVELPGRFDRVARADGRRARVS
jgi:hypothetical protein